MNFLLSRYIYPLKAAINLSSSLNFRLDNPRTDDEILFIQDHLERTHSFGYGEMVPTYSDAPVLTIEHRLLKFRDTFAMDDEYISEIFQSYHRESAIEFLARIWVIVRFDDEGTDQIMREHQKKSFEEGQMSFFLLEDEHPIIRNSEMLMNYAHLLSLLIHTEKSGYMGKSFIIEPSQMDSIIPSDEIWSDFLMFVYNLAHYPESGLSDSAHWLFFPYAIQEIQRVTKAFEGILAQGTSEKILYIGNMLKIVGQDVHNVRVKLVMLTSIIELMVTHNPDNSRFNVEDSISKQFQLKASILIYLNNRERDINEIKQRLKSIYQQRSNIAHGNFGEVEKYIKRLSKKAEKTEYFDNLITDLYVYIRAILEEYLKDKTFVDFVKES